MCKNPQVDIDGPSVTELMADVAAAVSRQAAAVSGQVYEVILRDIPELRDDKAVLSLLASSVHSNVGTCLQVMQHQIDLNAVQAPAAALEYARRRAQRGTSLTALLRAYRLGHTCFSDWLLKELARQTDDAAMITAATLGMSKIVAGYVDQTSEEIVAAYTRERENWLRNRSAARAARIRDLLSGRRINVSATEATLGYRLRQYHVGLVCWTGDAAAAVDDITRLEHAISHVAGKAACTGDPVFLPRDESSAWAWLPLGIRDTFDAAEASTAGADADLHFAFGDAAKGATGFRITHQQAIAAQAVALAAGSPAAGGSVQRGRTRGDDARLPRPAAGLGAQHAGRPGHRRRAPRSPARHPADLPAGRGQLQDDGRTADGAQEHGPVPDPQGRGEPRPAGGRAPARRGTRAAGQPVAGLVRAPADPGTTIRCYRHRRGQASQRPLRMITGIR